MQKSVYINLPVHDLKASTRFYETIGCSMNATFSNHQASSMVWSETVNFHLLTRDFFATFTPGAVADARNGCGALFALSCENREAVDAIVEAAAAGGGTKDPRPPQDMGFMYLRTFADPDGHIFEPFWMDPKAQMG